MRKEARNSSVVGVKLADVRKALVKLAKAHNDEVEVLMHELREALFSLGFLDEKYLNTDVKLNKDELERIVQQMNFAEEMQTGNSPIEAGGWGWWWTWSVFAFQPGAIDDSPRKLFMNKNGDAPGQGEGLGA